MFRKLFKIGVTIASALLAGLCLTAFVSGVEMLDIPYATMTVLFVIFAIMRAQKVWAAETAENALLDLHALRGETKIVRRSQRDEISKLEAQLIEAQLDSEIKTCRIRDLVARVEELEAILKTVQENA